MCHLVSYRSSVRRLGKVSDQLLHLRYWQCTQLIQRSSPSDPTLIICTVIPDLCRLLEESIYIYVYIYIYIRASGFAAVLKCAAARCSVL